MSEYIRGLTHALMVVLMVAGLSACDGENHNSSAQLSTQLSSGMNSSLAGVSSINTSSGSSSSIFHYDLNCPRGFKLAPAMSNSHYCIASYAYTGGYTPSDNETCPEGLYSGSYGGYCLLPTHACSWGLDTDVCKTACADAPNSSDIATAYCSQLSSADASSLSSSSSCPNIQIFPNGSSTCGNTDTCLTRPDLPQCQTGSSSSVSSVEVIINENAICEAFEQSTQWYDYYTMNLQDVTRSDPSIIKGLWRVSFNKGQITLVDGDAVINGTYTCLGNQVTATYALTAGLEEHIIELKHEGGAALEFDPYGQGLTAYGTGDKFSTPSTDCAKVKGRRYIGNEDDRLTAHFASTTNSVTYMSFDGIERQGFYTCDAGSLSISTSDDFAPFLQMYGNGSMIFFGKHSLSEVPVACTANYDPVCGVTETEIQCIAAPCPSPLKNYKTFGNSCAAFAGHADVIAQGECGELEGQELSSSSSSGVQK